MRVSCLFLKSTDGWQCSRCGRLVRLQSEKPPTAACKASPGLGDYVAVGLESVGVTKDRVSAVIGMPCNCPERQAKLNSLGKKYLGIGAGDDASS
jgi:hypothetical protein